MQVVINVAKYSYYEEESPGIEYYFDYLAAHQGYDLIPILESIYNDMVVGKGGDTQFTAIGLSVPPQKGVLLIWNNNLPDGRPNEDTMHAGMPVTKGKKYVLTKWYRSRKWGY